MQQIQICTQVIVVTVSCVTTFALVRWHVGAVVMCLSQICGSQYLALFSSTNKNVQKAKRAAAHWNELYNVLLSSNSNFFEILQSSYRFRTFSAPFWKCRIFHVFLKQILAKTLKKFPEKHGTDLTPSFVSISTSYKICIFFNIRCTYTTCEKREDVDVHTL